MNIFSGLCFFWSIPSSSIWLESPLQEKMTFQGVSNFLDFEFGTGFKKIKVDDFLAKTIKDFDKTCRAAIVAEEEWHRRPW